jgi:hypothetical protein
MNINSTLDFLEFIDYENLQQIHGIGEKKIEQIIKNIESVEKKIEETPLLFLQALNIIPNLGESVINKVFENFTVQEFLNSEEEELKKKILVIDGFQNAKLQMILKLRNWIN